MNLRETLQSVWTENTFVQLITDEGTHAGFVLAIGLQLILVQAIYDYQDVGALVIPIRLIKACKISEYAVDQLKILDFTGIKPTKRYNWVRIHSLPKLFKSLQLQKKFVVLSTENEGSDVGLISTVEDNRIFLKSIDPGGNWDTEDAEWSIEDISLIQFDDPYSQILQRYVETRSPN